VFIKWEEIVGGDREKEGGRRREKEGGREAREGGEGGTGGGGFHLLVGEVVFGEGGKDRTAVFSSTLSEREKRREERGEEELEGCN